MEEASSGSSRPDKPVIIRNREVDRAAKSLAEEHVLPQPPGKTVSWDKMQEYLDLLSPDMWDHLSIYVYRLKPKIRRQLVDPDAKNYIDCLGEPFTKESFIGRHGGGKYMFQAVDADKTNKEDHGRELFQCFLTVDDVKYEPILNYAELERDAKENQSFITWLISKGKLDAKGNPVQANSTVAAATNGLTATKDVLEIVKAINAMNTEQQAQLKAKLAPEEDGISKSVGNILLEKMRQDDPTKQAEVWTKLVSSLKDIIGTSKSDNGVSTVYDKLITMQAEHTKTVLGLLDRVFQNQQRPPEPARTAIDDFDKVLNLADKLRGWAGGGSGGKRTGWDIGYDIARDIGLPLVQTVGATFTNIMALRRNAAAATGVPGMPGVPVSIDPYKDPKGAAAYAASLKTQPPAAATETPQAGSPAAPPAAPPETPAPVAGALAILQQYGQLVLNAINSGTPGFNFADNLVGLMGQSAHASVAVHGEDALVGAMLSIPEFQIFGEPRLRNFVHEFINFEEYLDQEDEGIEPDQIERRPPPSPPQETYTSRLYRPPESRK